ncbi:hypothetical protein MNEG_12013 [Monoraphidium neglectum]|uniref:Uncharacterized protein n=1 Tax=Monoraphidium neglectum TaxID=145388 RepID=A0A0D2LWV2_9CHLO|nr:hypothetical protein MNEG_12013 [Monoraphidium neglectum]KIY95949.1 hypothetical protein MNEG_12013 [Monoraphidium neglectum]|eukprot:XP_013894969.1 hypothetical protein MNEG_12013 [Monoraphidium neglectum]
MEACIAPTNPAAAIRAAVSGHGDKPAAAAEDGTVAAAPAPAPALEPWSRLVAGGRAAAGEGRAEQVQRLMEASKPVLDGLYAEFSRQAERQGWKLHATMLNPRETRLLRVQPLAA